MNANIRTIGGSIGSQVVSAIVVAGAATGELPKESGYANGLVAMAIALAAAGLLALLIPGRARQADGDVHEVPSELALAADAAVLAAGVDVARR
jgi:hypothetical protein